MAYGYKLEAQYADGYVLREDEHDHSPYDSMKNIFHAILHQRPVKPHGKMVRFSLVGPDVTHTIDWTTLPDNARPIYLRQMESDLLAGGEGEARCMSHHFGYQYNDPAGHNHKELQEII